MLKNRWRRKMSSHRDASTSNKAETSPVTPGAPCLKRMAETCWQNPQAVTIRWVMLSLRSYSCLESCDNVASCVEDSCGCNEQRYCSILRIFRDLTPRPGLYNRKLNQAEVRSQQSIGHNLVGKAKILS